MNLNIRVDKDGPVRTQRRRGFTLIELLVVVGIIALLIAILLPSLAAARERSKKAGCLANLRGIGQAMNIYSYDNNDVLPNLNPAGVDDDPAAQDSALCSALFPSYLKGPKLLFCPSDRDKAPSAITTADYLSPNNARVSYDFYSIWWYPEKGPKLPKIFDAPIAWDLAGGLNTLDDRQNHGRFGGHVVYANGAASWQEQKDWDGPNWPTPATRYWLQ